ncbi:MAG: phage holin family protein [Prevotellaceae bacterium]|jgi:phage-related holin|nr:phage holin family protein [Prevotellaceae bacterium]
MNIILKYLVFVIGCVAAYFEPIKLLIVLVVMLFFADFITGVWKSVKVNRTWEIKSKRLRWSFVKMFVYLALVALSFLICGYMQLAPETAVSISKVQVWAIVYVEGLSIVENLLVIYPNDKFLKFLHYLLAVEFLKFIPVFGKFLKEEDK